MQEDFHYYATYCAAYLAGYSHEECMQICYSAQFVDCCSRTFLSKVNGPSSAATTQLQLEMMEAPTDPVGLQDITRIWSSFHFLPRDLYAESGKKGKNYNNKFRLICGPNGPLLVKTVQLAKGKPLPAAGIAMHVLADTWAHTYFAGTPSFVINNTDHWFKELVPDDDNKNGSSLSLKERSLTFVHDISSPDDLDKSRYTNSVYQISENTIMNLGHGRAGHLPDYSFIRYRYMPAWANYREITKDNPSDYYHAFCQMVYALKYLRGDVPDFAESTYDRNSVSPWENEIRNIIDKRQLIASEDWKAFGEKLSGRVIEDFDIDYYNEEYMTSAREAKDETFLGRFFLAAMAQKSMVTNQIFRSGNLLAGFSVDFDGKGLQGIRDFHKLVKNSQWNITAKKENQ